MKVLTIVGDPTSINNGFQTVLKDNPKMRIVTMAAAPYVVQQGGPHIKTVSNQAIPVHALYIVYDGVEVLVKSDGHPLEIVN